MKSSCLFLLIISTVAIVAVANGAEDHRTLIFSDDFENRTEIGGEYFTALGGPDAWQIQNGVLVGKQTNPDHGAVFRKEQLFDDIDIEIDFRFSGGSRFNFVIDDKNEKSVHAGHICRVSISSSSLKISDDKTGGMNLEVRVLREKKDLTPEAQKDLKKLLDRTSASAVLDFKPGTWYHLRVRILDDLLSAFIDDKLIASLRSPGIAHPTKTKFGMTVNDATIDFDNLTVFKATKRYP